MANSRFHLEPYSPKTRHTCPSCGKPRRFARYIDEAGEIEFPPHVGKCERLNNCGYHHPPRDWFADHPDAKSGISEDWKKLHTQPDEPTFFPRDIFWKTLAPVTRNNLGRFLASNFGQEEAQRLFSLYSVGTTKDGAAVFWQIDSQGRVRSGKIIQYDPTTGRRVKTAPTSWAHRVLKMEPFNLQQIYFGSHLLKSGAMVGVVESEKTAIIASRFCPDKTWIATGGLGMITYDRFKHLESCPSTLYPDLGKGDKRPFKIWAEQALKLREAGFPVSISGRLEEIATKEDREKGLDIADFLLRK